MTQSVACANPQCSARFTRKAVIHRYCSRDCQFDEYNRTRTVKRARVTASLTARRKERHEHAPLPAGTPVKLDHAPHFAARAEDFAARHEDCQHYTGCLDYAQRQDWPAFSCGGCAKYDPATLDDKRGWVQMRGASSIAAFADEVPIAFRGVDALRQQVNRYQAEHGIRRYVTPNRYQRRNG